MNTMAQKPKLVYVSGPYTSGDTVLNVRKTIEKSEEIVELDAVPFVPHLFHFWHFMSPHEYGYWMQIDMRMVLACDILYRISGYSRGADREVALAQEQGIPVVHTIEELRELLT